MPFFQTLVLCTELHGTYDTQYVSLLYSSVVNLVVCYVLVSSGVQTTQRSSLLVLDHFTGVFLSLFRRPSRCCNVASGINYIHAPLFSRNAGDRYKYFTESGSTKSSALSFRIKTP